MKVLIMLLFVVTLFLCFFGIVAYTEVKLAPVDGQNGDPFGYHVAFQGTNIVVGNYGDDDNGFQSGSIYVYTESSLGAGDFAAYVTKIVAFDGDAGDIFGYGVDVDGLNIVAGAQYDEPAGYQSGSAYVLTETNAGDKDWVSSQVKLVSPDGAASARFGNSVRIFGLTVICNQIVSDGVVAGAKAIYLFSESAAGAKDWTSNQNKLYAIDGYSGQGFAGPFQLYGLNVVVGASSDDQDGITDAGAVYVFTESVAGARDWAETKLRRTAPQESEYLGGTVSIHEMTIVAAMADGIVAIFRESSLGQGNWYENQSEFITLLGGLSDFDGTVLTKGDTSDDDLGTNAGAIYVRYESASGAWDELKLKAAGGSAGDLFGRSAAVDAGRIVVGAQYDANAVGYIVVFSSDNADPCSSSPCVESGCYPTVLGDYECFMPCDSSPCQHGGSCENIDEYLHSCACRLGTTGESCDIDIDDCSESRAWYQAERLNYPNALAGYQFGTGTAHNSDHVLIGMRGFEDGVVFIYNKTDPPLQLIRNVTSSFGQTLFGSIIALNDELAVISLEIYRINETAAGKWYSLGQLPLNPRTINAHNLILCTDTTDSNSKGAAYIFYEESQDTFAILTKLVGSQTVDNDLFGWGADISDTNVLVVTQDTYTNGEQCVIYVFVEVSHHVWEEQAIINSISDSNSGFFRGTVAIRKDGQRFVIGARNDDTTGWDAGAIFIFERTDTGWDTGTRIANPQGAHIDACGSAVAAIGDAVIMACGNDDTPANFAGSIFVFKKSSDGLSWAQEGKLLHAGSQENDHLGRRVLVWSSGTWLHVLAGVHEDNEIGIGSANAQGAAYIFTVPWNPCENQGMCLEDGINEYECNCGGGFTGSTCSYSLCFSSPCYHGGTCIADEFGYTCICPSGFTGENCTDRDIVINENMISSTGWVGYAVTLVGDIDGDNVLDIAYGDQINDDVHTDAGALLIVLMNPDGTPRIENVITEGVNGFVGPLHDTSAFGSSVDGIEDLNGDLVIDLVVGAYKFDDGGDRSGAVFILFLTSDGTVDSEQKISETTGGLTNTISNGDEFGRTVAYAGDLDNDGSSDILVGAFKSDSGGGDFGCVFVILLQQTGLVKQDVKIYRAHAGFTGPTDGLKYFGLGLCSIDVDGDSARDIVVGHYTDATNGVETGAIYIIFFSSDLAVTGERKISAATPELSGRLNAIDRFGYSVSGLGEDPVGGGVFIAAGTYADDEAGENQGAFYVLLLTPDGTVTHATKISGIHGGLDVSLDGLTNFGVSLSGVANDDDLFHLVVGGSGFLVVLSLNISLLSWDIIAPEFTLCPVSESIVSSAPITPSIAVQAVDDVDPSPLIICQPSLSSLFAPGTTTPVLCNATDELGNVAFCDFTVTIVPLLGESEWTELVVIFNVSAVVSDLESALSFIVNLTGADPGQFFNVSLVNTTSEETLSLRFVFAPTELVSVSDVESAFALVIDYCASDPCVASVSCVNFHNDSYYGFLCLDESLDNASSSSSPFESSSSSSARRDSSSSVDSSSSSSSPALASSSSSSSSVLSSSSLSSSSSATSVAPPPIVIIEATNLTNVLEDDSNVYIGYPASRLSLTPTYIVTETGGNVTLTGPRLAHVLQVMVHDQFVSFTTEKPVSGGSEETSLVRDDIADAEPYTTNEALHTVHFFAPPLNSTDLIGYHDLHLWMTPLITDVIELVTVSHLVFYVEASSCLDAGEYLDNDGNCHPCPSTATCPGGGRLLPKEGYWTPDEHSPPVECVIYSACPGGELNKDYVCANGYTGYACGECDAAFYQENGVCRPCYLNNGERADVVLRLLLACSLALVLILGVVFVNGIYITRFVSVVKTVQWVVVLGQAASQEMPWPWFGQFFSFLSIVNFDVDMIKPGCTVPAITTAELFWVTLCVILFTMAGCALAVYARMRWFKISVQNTKPRLLLCMLMILELTYFRLITLTVRGVHCIDVNGEARLAVELYTECYQGDHIVAGVFMWLVLLGLALGYTGSLLRIFLKRKHALERANQNRHRMSISMHSDYIALDSYFIHKYLPSRYFLRILPYMYNLVMAVQLTVSPNATLSTFLPCIIFTIDVVTILVFLPFKEPTSYRSKILRNGILFVSQLVFMGLLQVNDINRAIGQAFIVIAVSLFIAIGGFVGYRMFNGDVKLVETDNEATITLDIHDGIASVYADDVTHVSELTLPVSDDVEAKQRLTKRQSILMIHKQKQEKRKSIAHPLGIIVDTEPEISLSCVCCELARSAIFCEECGNESLCEECSGVIHSLRKHRAHQLTLLEHTSEGKHTHPLLHLEAVASARKAAKALKNSKRSKKKKSRKMEGVSTAVSFAAKLQKRSHKKKSSKKSGFVSFDVPHTVFVSQDAHPEPSI